MSSSARHPDMRRLDVAWAARTGFEGQGDWPLAGFERLREGDPAHDTEQPPQGVVHWSVRALQRPRAGSAPEVRLRLAVTAQVERVCQRCLQPVRLPLEVQRDFLFVASENEAAELDAENDSEDVLELTRHLDMHALIEDELLLALPRVPRHEDCPQPLVVPAAASPSEADVPHPFAALARLRRPREG
jgi:uncharacterized protein